MCDVATSHEGVSKPGLLASRVLAVAHEAGPQCAAEEGAGDAPQAAFTSDVLVKDSPGPHQQAGFCWCGPAVYASMGVRCLVWGYGVFDHASQR